MPNRTSHRWPRQAAALFSQCHKPQALSLKRPKISQYMAMESGKLRLISTLPLLFIFSARPDVMVLISLREMGKNEDASLSFKYIILAVLFLHFPSKL